MTAGAGVPDPEPAAEARTLLRAALRHDPGRAALYLAQGWWREDTLDRWLDRIVHARPEAPAIIAAGATIDYCTLANRTARLAEGLRRLGVRAGDVVAVQLPNTPEFLVAYLAICRLGAVMTTLHMPYRAAELERLLGHSRARAAIVAARAKDWSPAETLDALRARLPGLSRVIVDAAEADSRGHPGLAELIDTSPPLDPDHPRPDPTDPFLLLYTSGTTALPKGVPHAYRGLLANARLGAPEHRIGPEDRILSAAPFSHLFGLYSLHVGWSCGAAALLLPMFTPPGMAAAIEAGRASALWTGPAHLAACRGLGLLDRHDFGTLRLAIVSGSFCPPELLYWFQERVPRCAVTQLWGMTETQGALYTRPGDPVEIPARTAGRPSPGTEVRIAAAGDLPVPAGTEGELQVRGCSVFTGFFDNPEADRDAFTADGWYRSGDLALADPSGNIALTGRLKDLINRGGVKFNPREVEELLESHPAIAQAAIVPMPDPVLGERSCCFVTLRAGAAPPALSALTAWLEREHRIARIKLPERLVVVDAMPLTPTRKIIKSRLIPPAE